MITALIGTLISGTIIGFGGRFILPGAQDIGLGKTIGLGVVASVLVGLVLGGLNPIMGIIVGSLVAAGLLWLAINKGWLRPDPTSSSRF